MVTWSPHTCTSRARKRPTELSTHVKTEADALCQSWRFIAQKEGPIRPSTQKHESIAKLLGHKNLISYAITSKGQKGKKVMPAASHEQKEHQEASKKKRRPAVKNTMSCTVMMAKSPRKNYLVLCRNLSCSTLPWRDFMGNSCFRYRYTQMNRISTTAHASPTLRGSSCLVP